MDPRRNQRVTEALREELTELIAHELSDPRVRGTTVVDVFLSPDGRQAEVSVHAEGDEATRRNVLEGLASARPFLRRELGSRLDLFRMPDLNFRLDLASELGPRLPSLLRRVRKGRPRPGADGENSPVT